MTDDIRQRLRAAARTLAMNHQRRDQLIFEAHHAGLSLRQIAAEVAMSPAGVRKILQKEQP